MILSVCLPDSLKMTTFSADITFLEQSKPFGVITHQFSNSTLIKLLDKKSGMFDFFREACIYFKTQFKIDINRLICDKGGEFEKIRQYCRSKGIVVHQASTATPQQNGMAERKNRTIFNVSRCLMLDLEHALQRDLNVKIEAI